MRLDRSGSRARAEEICDAETMIDGYEALYAEMIALAGPGIAGQIATARPGLSGVATSVGAHFG